ncbi:hypothetical protein IWX84_001427 [Flavobacterium sp. CG_9.10]|uniref:hypothetical protein n=1 Tax=Flavobacterium sp. CG_9.10 TaxID=2787729 RepID=UPI0018C9C2AF|nr:hypothetical protein [Flavobacterium sp. CG_9.10]MBG6110548.1 hypothetical protein [Flavobacterium sp. CG_9.10]
MKKFILKLIITGFIAYSLLMSLQLIIDFYLSKDNICNNNTWYKIFEGKLQTDIVILGTSRAESHYDTEILNKITGLKTYNLGLSGTHYNLLKIRWEAYINRNIKPKIVILDIDDIALQDSEEIYDKFQYLPYYESEEYQKVSKDIDKDFYFEKFFPIYKYRGYEMSIFNQMKSLKNNSFCSKSINGYVEHDINWIEKDYLNFKKILLQDKMVQKKNQKINSIGLSVIEEIIQYCKVNKIKIYFIWSPSYYELQTYQLANKKNVNQLIKNISQKHRIDYFNFSNDSLCLQKKYFYNSAHMNKNGVAIFSRKIGELINEKL